MGNQVNRLTIDRVLACPTLPSLPSVAAQVIELTRSEQVSAMQIAKIVQHDPALAGKVLKTVNSSYYGLATPCPSLSRAVTLLGLNTVKSIVLGFSLVDAARSVKGGAGLDLRAHWRRAIYTAAASRLLAQSCGRCDVEEAFLAALMQDIGALAIYCADPTAAAETEAASGRDHAELAAVERDLLGFDHAQVGGKLAERWRLPTQLRDAIANHHDLNPGGPHADLTRVVHIAGGVAMICEPDRPASGLAEIERKSREWLGLDSDMVRAAVERLGRDARELARSLDLDAGDQHDTGAILAAAHAELTRCSERMQMETTQLKRRESELTKASITDGLTGAFNRAHFETEVVAIDAAGDAASPFSVIFVDADHFKRINDRLGHAAGDAVLKELSRRLQKAVGRSGQVFRYGGEEFVILLRRIGLDQASRIAELLRRTVEADPVDISAGAPDAGAPPCAVTVSVGVATGAAGKRDARSIVAAADAAVYRAKRSGRNRVSIDGVEGGSSGTGGSGAQTVLIIEDDALAAKLLAVLFGRRRELKTLFATTGDEALAALRDGSVGIDLVVCDLNLPDLSGTDLVHAVCNARTPSPPVVVVSAASDDETRAAALAAGAVDFVPKGEFSNAIDKTLDRILGSSIARVAA